MGIPAYVYIVANDQRNLLYTGMTTDLVKRIAKHRDKKIRNFTAQFDITRLVYFELHPSIALAMKREQQIKSWPLDHQQALIEKGNPYWSDLWDGLDREARHLDFFKGSDNNGA